MRKSAELKADFFSRPVLEVAPDLPGRVLCRRLPETGEVVRVAIREVEAYLGPEDRASHARFKSSTRNRLMWGPPGVWYVYFIYGMYWMLNVICQREDQPGAILFRGAGDFTGPGKLTRALRIDRELNGQPVHSESGLWIEMGKPLPASAIENTPRIGIDYAGADWAQRPYRWVVRSK